MAIRGRWVMDAHVKNAIFTAHTTMKVRLIIPFALVTLSFGAFAQAAPPKQEDEPVKKNKTETKFTEVVTTDSLPAAELVKRAAKWIKDESANFRKTGGGTNGSKAEC